MLETPGSVDLCIDGKLETWLRNGRLRISHETPPPRVTIWQIPRCCVLISDEPETSGVVKHEIPAANNFCSQRDLYNA